MGPLCVLAAAVTASFVAPLLWVWPVVSYASLYATAVLSAPKSCPCIGEAQASATNGTRHAITMLVQKQSPKDVRAAIESLHLRFNDCFKKDVFVFHTGGVPRALQEQLTKRHPQVRFRLLPPEGDEHWRPAPVGLGKPPRPVNSMRYAAARWHSLGVTQYLGSLGYEWLLRWEPGALLLSCVASDPFRVLETRGVSHGYRLGRSLPAVAVGGLPGLLARLGASGRPLPAPLLARFRGGNLTYLAWDRQVQDGGGALTRVSFWRSPEVRAWLQEVDGAGLAYHLPLQDAALQTLTRALFAGEGVEEAYHFSDWTYLHGGELAVAPRSLLPSPLYALLPPGYEWRASAERLAAEPRYRVELAWVQRNIVGPVSRRDFWCLRFLRLLG
mmetsp:Transcript_77842/g.231909  ORF Transcript_77842/g.231909 Transcript_77842/m.231909 type:complete len:386 (+) Transcript_77842:94-1251(+)